MSEFHFLRPWWLLSVMPLSLMLVLLYWQYRRVNAWYKACDPHLLKFLLVGDEPTKRQHWLLGLAVTWLIASIALAGPTWSRVSQPLYRHTQGVVLAIDLSENMLAEDVKPNRLTRAKFKISDFLNLLSDSHIGMVAFAGEAYTVSPLTSDNETLRVMLSELKPGIMPVPGHNIHDALLRSAALLQQADHAAGHIILLTASEPNVAAFDTVQQLKQKGMSTSVIAFGTPAGAPILRVSGFAKTPDGQIIIAKLPQEKLQRLAGQGGGKFLLYTSDNQDIQILKTLLLRNDKAGNPEVAREFSNLWLDQGYWLVWLLLPLAAMAFRRGWMELLISH